MNFAFRPVARLLLPCFCLTALLNATGVLTPSLHAQQPSKTQSDDVLRINADLVQTAVTVVDKDGRFVDGLDQSKFELTVDGEPRPISFFEQVTAGSAREEQLATRTEPGAAATKTPAIPPSVRGRNIVFFIDDLHLSADSSHHRSSLHHR